ncbi:MAG: preprotein translocase subunit SecY [Candidatus Colwellbacteria bacterium RIFCSPLOWO2_01_FULL_48_10]|uniref:Protein translocase subunit SecY n=1 Tax=Candidatus Colwellbacteria bacterium RIFCSPLOWO2_01_FULL_48_10 TaxID=1797690 RepID=A0A1G1Z8I6_9BACT|nr:MAG: preprotein translocase subunit SecY [Candidatus Colwellbacteria bacterium RIFCSPLOWO2_01_FULL_48_10]
MLSKFLQIFRVKEIRNRLLTIAGLLIVFRFLAAIPVPGVNEASLKGFFEGNQLLGFLNIFSGGALSNLSIAMLGLGPYITSTIIMQLLTMIFPHLKAMYYEEGAQGRAKFNRFSRFLTVPLSAFQGFGFLKLLSSQNLIHISGPLDMAINVLTITAGSMILVWLGEIITEQKLGNGVSLLIFAGIVSGLPSILRNAYVSYSADKIPTYLAFTILALIVIAGIVLVNEGERKVPISYAKRVRGNRVYGGASSYLPLRVNQAGVIPIIFAISILLFPQFFGQIVSAFSETWGAAVSTWVTRVFNNQLIYGTIYFVLVFAFTYFYISVTFDPNEISKNLQRSGGFVPGIRPGEPTSAFLKSIISRITVFGASFLGLIAVLPIVVQVLTKTPALTIGGTALLIVVSVVLETAKQIDSQLTVREYESFQ